MGRAAATHAHGGQWMAAGWSAQARHAGVAWHRASEAMARGRGQRRGATEIGGGCDAGGSGGGWLDAAGMAGTHLVVRPVAADVVVDALSKIQGQIFLAAGGGDSSRAGRQRLGGSDKARVGRRVSTAVSVLELSVRDRAKANRRGGVSRCRQ
jgi:hypothetical protein